MGHGEGKGHIGSGIGFGEHYVVYGECGAVVVGYGCQNRSGASQSVQDYILGVGGQRAEDTVQGFAGLHQVVVGDGNTHRLGFALGTPEGQGRRYGRIVTAGRSRVVAGVETDGDLFLYRTIRTDGEIGRSGGFIHSESTDGQCGLIVVVYGSRGRIGAQADLLTACVYNDNGSREALLGLCLQVA